MSRESIKKSKRAKLAKKSPKKTRKSPTKSPRKRPPKKKRSPVGIQIGKLMKKGYPHKQAVAIALNMEARGRLGPKGGYKKVRKRNKSVF